LTESGGSTAPTVVSDKGAGGIMQFMPATAKAYGITDRFDPAQAIPGAAHYISDLLTHAEANGLQGPAAVSKALGGYYGREDPNYIGTVARHYSALSAPPTPAGAQDSVVGPSAGPGAPVGAKIPTITDADRAFSAQYSQPKIALAGVAAMPQTVASISGAKRSMADLSDPFLQQIINGGVPQAAAPPAPAPNPLAAVPQAGAPQAAASGTPVMDPQAYAAALKFAYKTPAMAGAIAPLVAGLGQGLPRMGGSHYIVGPDGQTQLVPIPGYVQGNAQIKGAEAGAEANSKVPAEN